MTPNLNADLERPINALCEECGEADAYTLVCVDGTNMAVCRGCHIWLDHHSEPFSGGDHSDGKAGA